MIAELKDDEVKYHPDNYSKLSKEEKIFMKKHLLLIPVIRITGTLKPGRMKTGKDW